jgi:hypothetical protein
MDASFITYLVMSCDLLHSFFGRNHIDPHKFGKLIKLVIAIVLCVYHNTFTILTEINLKFFFAELLKFYLLLVLKF